MEEEFKPTKHNDTMDSDIYEHPSFGTIMFARCQGGKTALFGSSIEHNHTIMVEIKTAELERSLQRDWIHGRKIIVRARMSPTQFADAITGLNSSEVPITLEYIGGGEEIPSPPFFSKVQQFNKEFEDDIKKIGKDFDDVMKLAEETKAQKRLRDAIYMLRMHFNSNLPFVNKSFTEQMEHTIKEAKGEVEAFVTGMVHSYGIEAIRKQAPQIGESINTIKQITTPDTEALKESSK